MSAKNLDTLNEAIREISCLGVDQQNFQNEFLEKTRQHERDHPTKDEERKQMTVQFVVDLKMKEMECMRKSNSGGIMAM